MRGIKIFAIVMAGLAAAIMPCTAEAQRQVTASKSVRKKTKKALTKENLDLQRQVDSLNNVLHNFERRHHSTDSMAEEIIDIYKENEDKIGAGLSPEDYTPDVTDSLLSIWYIQKQVDRSHEGTGYNMDSVRFTSNVSDKTMIKRLEKMNSYITLPYNETVRNYMILYSEKMPSKVAHMMALAKYYFPIFEETFNRYGMPEELEYMAVIESALNPTATSRAGAKGMWQFMYTTAKNYNLKINSYVDERLDPYKSADAAARYLDDAYRIFGDWNLAISSYNCGAGNVTKAIRRAGGSKNFWDIYEYLPRETRGYVPAFVGAMYAFHYSKEYGITPDKISLPAKTDTFQIRKNLHFGQISAVIGIPVQKLRDLNPQYTHDIIPGNEGTYVLRLPFEYTSSFVDMEDSIYNYKANEYFSPTIVQNIKNGTVQTTQQRIVYKVRKGDYLGRIASRYHVTVSQIKKWNNLRSNNLRIGQRLVIYKKVKVTVPAAPEPAKTEQPKVEKPKTDTSSQVQKTDTTKAAASPDSTSTSEKTVQKAEPKPEFTYYTVKKGDTLYGIAKKYPGVSANEIMKLNGIGSKIRPGQKLKIPNR
jgi:membrane-bound lytic murein transglycosylase D